MLDITGIGIGASPSNPIATFRLAFACDIRHLFEQKRCHRTEGTYSIPHGTHSQQFGLSSAKANAGR